MAISFDHQNQLIESTAIDPMIDGYLTIRAPSGGNIVIEGPLVCMNNVSIAGLQYPFADANDPSQIGKVFTVAEYEPGGDRYIDIRSVSYNDLTNKPALFSGSYNDLTNKPTLFSGSYNDLTDLPAPAEPETITWTDVQGKPTFATVATTGSYNDLTDKPSGGGGGTDDATVLLYSMIFGG